MNQNQKQFIINWFRGWLPQEPRLRHQATPSIAKPTKATNILNTAASLFLVFGLFASFFLLKASPLKDVLITIAIICGLVYLLGRRRPRIKRAVIKALVPVMIFALCFTGVEVCLFWNAGYPTTFSAANPKASLTVDSMLNASVVEMLQGIEQSPAFSLLRLEHGEGIRFSQMYMDSWQGGEIRVYYVTEDERYHFQFTSSDGSQYRLQVSTSGGFRLNYASANTTTQALTQIDSVGLNCFYNKAVAYAENKTANLPSVDSIHINIVKSGDEGLSVQVIGYHVESTVSGGLSVDNVLYSSFRSNDGLN